ncbi:MAG: NAD-dependent epimerase/dehydratase family protein [Candidatus Hodarchaeota archaeon]
MRYKGKKVLVAGGAGFVGSNLVKKLSDEGALVTVLDDLFTGDYSFIAGLLSTTFVKGSVTDYDLVEDLVKQADIVFNLAARNIIVATKRPREDFNVNAGGMLNILIAARKYGIEKIVYSSSASVYGNARYLPINEDDRLNILNPYAASKLSAENYCMAFYESYDLPVTILRYSNVFGTNQSPSNPYCGVVSKFFTSVLSGEPPQIHGDGEQTRDFTFVDDVVEATMLAALSPKVVGEVLNVGTGKETTVRHLANIIIGLSGKDLRPLYIDRRDIDNLRRRVLNIEKIRKNLRWIPSIPLEEGLSKTYEWLIASELNKTKKTARQIPFRLSTRTA